MKTLYLSLSLLLGLSFSYGNQIAESQQKWLKPYAKHTKIVSPEDALINTDAEPDLNQGFTHLYNGKNLDGWVVRGGKCTFEADGESIIGTCVRRSPNTFLSTEREDYSDFIFTAELKWEVDGNSGIMFRSQRKPGEKFETVYGPQCEMEGFSKNRGWSGAIYGQSIGGWIYPLWLEAHETARQALKESEWNRVTIQAIGKDVKTWINGIPAAHWIDEEYGKGLIALQVHQGKEGTIRFKNIKIKELTEKDLFASGDFSEWTTLKGQPVTEGWEFQDGVIYRGGKRPGDIITKKHYTDFDLSFEWKISEAGNSGIKYRTRGSLGLEYQVLDDEKHPDNKHLSHRAGSLYALIAAPDSKPIKPVGEWNSARIIAQGNHVEHWLNGVKVVEVEIGSELWKTQFGRSKYKEHEGFGTWTGPILLQDHRDPTWFRNIKIKEL